LQAAFCLAMRVYNAGQAHGFIGIDQGEIQASSPSSTKRGFRENDFSFCLGGLEMLVLSAIQMAQTAGGDHPAKISSL
jgi:hypothetical protein